MKNIIAVVVLFTCIGVLYGNVNIHEGTRYHFTGSLNEKYPIFMTLAFEDFKVTGMYYYYSIGTHIDLEGTYTNDGSFMINEFVNDECTGTYTGTFVNGYTVASGSWSNASGTKNLSFSLDLVAGEIVTESSYFEVTAHVPQFGSEAKAIQNIIADTITALFDDFIDSYSTDMEDEPEWGWEFICDYTIEYYSEFFISILLEIYEHTGGAHGNVYYICLNCLQEKKYADFLALEDFFVDDVDYGAILSDLCISELKKQEAAWILDGSIQELNTDLLVFNVTPKGLQFTFAPYAVGPYAEGPHWITVTYNELKNIINDRGPLGEFVQ